MLLEVKAALLQDVDIHLPVNIFFVTEDVMRLEKTLGSCYYLSSICS